MSGRTFIHLECPDCGWTCVLARAEVTHRLGCPLCGEDNRRDVLLRRRDAVAADKVEGFDARKALVG